MHFKATAVRLSELPDILIQDVAEAVDIHPFMLSRWRQQAREGLIVAKGIKLDDETVAELQQLRDLVCCNASNKYIPVAVPTAVPDVEQEKFDLGAHLIKMPGLLFGGGYKMCLKFFHRYHRNIASLICLYAVLHAPAIYAENSVKISLDLRDAGLGKAAVAMSFRQTGSIQSMLKPGKKGEFTYTNIKASQGGKEIEIVEIGDSIRFAAPVQGGFDLRYFVAAGGKGRHGRQGYIDEQFASSDGRLFLIPENSASFAHIELEFQLPKKWRAVVPFARSGGKFIIRSGEMKAMDQLRQAGYAFGHFNSHVKSMQGTALAIHTSADWPADYQNDLVQKTARLFAYLQNHYAFQPEHYDITWTPQAPDGSQVYGTSWAYGVQYEMPQQKLRNWEFLVHRVIHAINKYPPTGMLIAAKEDEWFNEGWASYLEIEATAATGLAPDARRWNDLYQRYVNTLRRSPKYDLPLAQESLSQGETTEYLHYIKAPLVVKMLEFYLQSKGGVKLSDAMAHIVKNYGKMQGAIPLRQSLEQFTGVALDEFWQHQVRQVGHAIPVWDEYRTQLLTPSNTDYAATVAGAGVPSGYLAFIASAGIVEHYSELLPLLQNESMCLQAYRSRGVVLLPDFLVTEIEKVSGPVRRQIHRFLCQWTPPQAKAPEVVFNKDSTSGVVLLRLIALEKLYQQQRGSTAIRAVHAKRDNSETLALPPGIPIKFYIQWLRTGMQAQFALVNQDGRILLQQNIFIQPNWNRSFMEFVIPVDATDPILNLTVSIEGKVILTRAYWQYADLAITLEP